MTPADVARLRLSAQRISATTFTEPHEAVRSLGAVQAQDYLGALWAVGLRLTRADESGVERALADRTIVRTWPMRGTLHFVAAADARWMLRLLAPRAMAGAAGRRRQLGLDGATLARAGRVLLESLSGSKRLSRPAALQALERAGISTAGQRGIHILGWLAQDGLLCFGPRDGKQQTFVLLDEWLPRTRALERDEALAELARRYFTGHGPATVADFVWWSGLTTADAKAAVALAASWLEETDVLGRTHWHAPHPTPPANRSRAHLLPGFDELVLGYRDRSASVAAAHRQRLNPGTNGMLSPIIVIDGRVVGTWKRTLVRGGVAFSPAPFTPLSATRTGAVALASRSYARFLNLPLLVR